MDADEFPERVRSGGRGFGPSVCGGAGVGGCERGGETMPRAAGGCGPGPRSLKFDDASVRETTLAC